MVDEVHEEQRHNAVGDREVGQVEGQLQRRLTAMDQSAMAVPATIESTTTSGGAKKNPTTSGSSLSEKE